MRYLLVLSLLLAACAPSRSTPAGSEGPPPNSELPELTSGWYFGECGGDCQGRLEIASDGSFTFSTFGWDDVVSLTVEGALTDDTLADIEEAHAALDRIELESVYGCPDCADGGGEFLEFASGVGPSRIDWQWGSPPDELKDLISWLNEIQGDAQQCDGSDGLITIDSCVRSDLGGDGDPGDNETDPEPPPPGR